MIGNKSEYFLKVLIELARRQGDGHMTSREIAERQAIPPKYIPQIVAELSRAGWVETSRGPGGGIRLAVDPAGITVADVIDLAEGGFTIKNCLVSARPCPLTESCPLYPVWLEAQHAVSGILASYSIADLVYRKWENEGGTRGEN